MPKPVFELITHKGLPRIKVFFENNEVWNRRMKQVPGAAWSKTLHSWHIPDTAENRKKCGLPMEAVPVINDKTGFKSSKTTLLHIDAVNKPAMEKFLQTLQLKAYSPSTLRTYKSEFAAFFTNIKKHKGRKL